MAQSTSAARCSVHGWFSRVSAVLPRGRTVTAVTKDDVLDTRTTAFSHRESRPLGHVLC
jgi:hypothetical protein